MTKLQSACCTELPELEDEQLARLAKIFQLPGDPKRLQLVLACLSGRTSACLLSVRYIRYVPAADQPSFEKSSGSPHPEIIQKGKAGVL